MLQALKGAEMKPENIDVHILLLFEFESKVFLIFWP